MAGIDMCAVRLDLEQDPGITPVELRGFLARKFSSIPEFHHHSAKSYHYPLVQYKTMGGLPTVFGVLEFAEIVYRKMSELDFVEARGRRMQVRSATVRRYSHEFSPETGMYGFASPWIALNKENHGRFSKASKDQKGAILEGILTGNILSMLKGVGVFADRRIEAKMKRFEAHKTDAHGNRFVGIRARFESNVRLPAGLGLGKSVSKGFGVLEAA